MRPLHHTFAPLADGRQIRAAVSLLLRPWQWREGAAREALRAAVAEKFGREAFLFASGREALLAFLRSCTFPAGSEIVVQGYTCVVVPNAIAAAGLTPVYCDIEKDTLSMDPEAVERAITPRTKAILCQHTFGIPAPVEALRTLCDRHGLLLIEDCAHILPDAKGPDEIGRHGDALLLSFGRDKAVSGVTGGAISIRKDTSEAEPSSRAHVSTESVTLRSPPVVLRDGPSPSSGPPQHDTAGVSKGGASHTQLQSLEQQAIDLPFFTVFRLLLYPLLYALARPLYGLRIGKALLWLAGRTRLLLPIVTREEKHGRQSPHLHRLPNACAALALEQLQRLQAINDHRRSLVARYLQASADHGWPVLRGIRASLPLQKFPLFVRNAEEIRGKLKKRNIHLHDGWTGCVVCPADVRIDETGYRKGADPKAEEACEEILTLPTHPGMAMEDAERLIELLDPVLTSSLLPADPSP